MKHHTFEKCSVKLTCSHRIRKKEQLFLKANCFCPCHFDLFRILWHDTKDKACFPSLSKMKVSVCVTRTWTLLTLCLCCNRSASRNTCRSRPSSSRAAKWAEAAARSGCTRRRSRSRARASGSRCRCSWRAAARSCRRARTAGTRTARAPAPRTAAPRWRRAAPARGRPSQATPTVRVAFLFAGQCRGLSSMRSCLTSTFRSVTSEADVFERGCAKSETFMEFVFFPFCEVPKYTFELNVCPEKKHFKKEFYRGDLLGNKFRIKKKCIWRYLSKIIWIEISHLLLI